MVIITCVLSLIRWQPQWKRRPLNLLTSRSYLTKWPSPTESLIHNLLEGDYQRGKDNFLDSSWEEIERHIENDRLTFVNDPEPIAKQKGPDGTGVVSRDLMMTVCKRYHDRDAKRLHQAHHIESKCRPSYANESDTLEIRLDKERVVESEVGSLLHYLRELLVYKFGVYHLKPRKELGLHNEASWHVTPQTKGLCARQRGMDTPENADYVECYWP